MKRNRNLRQPDLWQDQIRLARAPSRSRRKDACQTAAHPVRRSNSGLVGVLRIAVGAPGIAVEE